MKGNFERCVALVLHEEGGYVNDPADPGGETNFGISKRSYPKEDIRGMTRERAKAIYRRDYWDAVRGDDLPAGLDHVAFDAAVNSGVSRGAKWLQGALGVAQDGRIGPKTIAAANKANEHAIVNIACDERLAFLRGLKTWNRFGRGWTARVERVRSNALAMAEEIPMLGLPTSPAKPTSKPLVGLLIFAAIVAAAAYYFLKG